MTAAIVSGVLAGKAGNGGNAWTRVSMICGLRRLGLSVTFVEQLPAASAESRAYFDAVCDEFEIDGHLLDGIAPPELIECARDASLLVNIGGHLTLAGLKDAPRVRVYVDDDPAYTQLWHAQGLIGDKLAGHHLYFSLGENIGRAECDVPTGGIDWLPMKPPVVLADWSRAADARAGFTTVARWRGAYGRAEWNGRLFGQKAHEFRRFIHLPLRATQPFEIALDIDAADAGDRDLLLQNGWTLVDPREVAASPDDFRRYVQGSGAEFSVAQGIYVETSCGWFSDRTTRYLASGRPALVQNTGFSMNIPTGEGLIAFSTIEEAVAGASAIQRDYRAHSDAARAIAELHFDSDKILGSLLERAGV
jgi:hypothetical protein